MTDPLSDTLLSCTDQHLRPATAPFRRIRFPPELRHIRPIFGRYYGDPELLGEVKRWQWWLKADRQAAHDDSLARYEKAQAGLEKAEDAAREAKTKAEKTAGASFNWDTSLTKAQTFIENYESARASRLERVARAEQWVAHHEQADQQLRARMQQMLDEKRGSSSFGAKNNTYGLTSSDGVLPGFGLRVGVVGAWLDRR